MPTILITDDDVQIRNIVEMTLGFGAYRILQAEDGAGAVEIARREKPDLVIMDIMMPGDYDGLEATRILKSDPETRNCTVILLTAVCGEQDMREGYAAGADGYFTKPFSPLALIRKVEEVLEQRAG
jgi:CheY-like chemotaxis protein